MRIIAGTARGRKLYLPEGQDIRPTSDKIRGAIFNALHSRGVLEDAAVLDGFSGTGALGLEALSRGAREGVFVDVHPASIALTKKNAQVLGFSERSVFYTKSLLMLEPLHDPLVKRTLVFLDPPYRKDLIKPALERLIAGSWLAEKAIIVAEMEREAEPVHHAALTTLFEKTYGETRVQILSYEPF